MKSARTILSLVLLVFSCLLMLPGTSAAQLREPKLIVFPKGNDKLVIGSDTTIQLRGFDAEDTILLRYSTNAGTAWKNVVDTVTQSSYVWTVPPPECDSCLLNAEIVSLRKRIPSGRIPLELEDASMSADGKFIATTSPSGVDIYNAATGELVRYIPMDRQTQGMVALDPTGSKVAILPISSSQPGAVYNVATGNLLFAFTPTSTMAQGLLWSRDGKYLLYKRGFDFGSWNTQTATPAFVNDTTQTHISPLDAAPNNTWFVASVPVSANGEALIVYDFATGNEIKRVGTDPKWGFIWSASWNNNGTRIATVYQDSSLRIWNYETGAQIHQMKIPGEWLMAVRYSQAGNNILVSGSSGKIYVIDGDSFQILDTLDNKYPVRKLHLSTNDSRLLTVSGWRIVRLWDMQKRLPILSRGGRTHMGHPSVVQWAPDSVSLVLSYLAEGTLVFDSRTGLHNTLSFTQNLSSVPVLNSKGTFFYGLSATAFHRWSATTGQWIDSVFLRPIGSYLDNASLNINDTLLAVTSKYGAALQLYNAITGAPISEFAYGNGSYYDGQWSHNGKWLAGIRIGDQPYLEFWSKDDLQNRRSYVIPQPLDGQGIVWSPDDRFVAISSDNGILIVRAEDGAIVHTLLAESFAYAPSWSPDGLRIAGLVAAQPKGNTIRIWNVAEQKLEREFGWDGEYFIEAKWSPDGKYLAARATQAGALYLWSATFDATTEGYFHIVRSIATSHDYDFDTVAINKTRMIDTPPMVSNGGEYRFQVRSIEITGQHASEFTITNAPLPYNVEVGGSLGAQLHFAPNALGERTATLTIITQSDTLVHQLRGVGGAPSSVDRKELLRELTLASNPVRDRISVDVSLTQSEHATLELLDVTGRVAGIVFDGRLEAGSIRLNADVSMLPSGTYFLSYRSASSSEMRRVEIVR